MSASFESRHHHVALSVSDLEQATRFYELLGYERVRAYDEPNGLFRILHIRKADDIIELFHHSQHETPPQNLACESRDIRRVGAKHFALQVQRIDETRELLSKLFPDQKLDISTGRTGIKYLFLSDPDGNQIEFVEEP